MCEVVEIEMPHSTFTLYKSVEEQSQASKNTNCSPYTSLLSQHKMNRCVIQCDSSHLSELPLSHLSSFAARLWSAYRKSPGPAALALTGPCPPPAWLSKPTANAPRGNQQRYPRLRKVDLHVPVWCRVMPLQPGHAGRVACAT